MMDRETKQLYIQLVEAGKFDQAANLQAAYEPALGQRTGGREQGEREMLLERGRAVGLDREDLFVPEESNASKFVADMGAGFLEQGLGAQQLAEHLIPGRNVEDIDARVREAGQEYQESGLADEVTGGKLLSNVIPAVGGGLLARGMTAAAPLRTAMGLGALEEVVQPVSEDNYWTEKAKDVGFGATVGAVTESPTGVIRVMEEARNIPGRVVNRLSKPSKKEGGGILRGDAGEQSAMSEVQVETNIDFTPGQVSQSGMLQQGEELARSGLFTRNKVARADAARAGQYDDYIKGYRDSLGSDAPIDVVAPKVQSWGRQEADKLINYRATEAGKDYAPIRAYDGGQPTIPADTYRGELESMVARANTAGASNDIIKAGKNAEGRLARLEEQGGYLTGTDVDQLTRASGEYSGSAFDVKDVSFDDALSTRIRNAVEEDIAGIPELTDQLAIAKANYGTNSSHIDEFEKGLVGQVLGKQMMSDVDGVLQNTVTPEAMFQKFRTSSPTQITAAMRHLDSKSPGLGDELRAGIIERARAGAMYRPPAGGLDESLDPATFLRNLGITSGGEKGMQGFERLNALFPENPDAVRALYRAGLILGDKTMANTSKTAVTTAARDTLEAAMSLVGGSIRKLLGSVGSVAGMNQIANAMQVGARAGVQDVVMGSTRRVLGGGRIPIRAVSGATTGSQGDDR